MDRERKGNSYLVVKSKNPPEVKKIMLSMVPQTLYCEQFKLTFTIKERSSRRAIKNNVFNKGTISLDWECAKNYIHEAGARFYKNGV